MATSKRSLRNSARRRRPALANAPSAPPAAVDPRLIEGVALYNHHQFFECHEVLEALWRDTTGRARDFYKGLIQAAVAFYHWSRGNPAGALSLYRSSTKYLRRYAPKFLGVDTAGFLGPYTELFGWLRRHRLPYDPRLVPPLRWVSGAAPSTASHAS